MNKCLLILIIAFANNVFAGQMNAVPSCYSKKLAAPIKPIDTEFFLVIDQTTSFSDGLKQSIADNVRNFIQPNYAFSVSQFSAFTQDHYTDVLVSGKLDIELSEAARNNVSKPILTKFDHCMSSEKNLAAQSLGGAMKSAFGNSSDKISKSDIFSSLKAISSMVKQSKASRKVVFIASDMLENSSITSFYAKQAVRNINPDKEMVIVEKNLLLGDFGSAEIYVMGAGLLSNDTKQAKNAYRSPQIMQSLSIFWKTWFQKSNANLIEFGQPALLNAVK